MYGIIYKITNLVNGKIYIGQTIQKIENRFQAHVQQAYSKNKPKYYLHNAILKYGEDNFIIEQIDKAETVEELNQLEIMYIKFYKTNNPHYGYNMTKGGESGYTREVCQLDLDGKLIKIFPSLSQAKDAVNLKNPTSIINCCINKYNTAAGYQWCYKEDLKDRINKPALKKRQTNVLVDQYDLNNNYIKTWNSIKEAEETLNIAHSHISAVCRGKRNTAGNFIWKYHNKDQLNKEREHISKRKVSQYDLNGQYIKTFDSIEEAAKTINQKKGGHISDVCKGKRKTCGGYIWKYEE